MRFLYSNLFDTAGYTLTENSEESTYPVENTQDYQLSKHYRTTGDTSEWVKIDGLASEAITANIAFIAGHNITSGATTIKIQGSNTDSWSPPTVDETITHSTGVMWDAFTSDDLRYWRWLIADASNPDTYLKIGRLGLGTYFDLTNWPATDFDPRPIDTSTSRRSPTGQLYGNEGVIYYEYDYYFSHLTNTEKVNMVTMWETNKKVKPILMIPNPSDTTLPPVYGIIKDFRYKHKIGYTWKAWITIAEAL